MIILTAIGTVCIGASFVTGIKLGEWLYALLPIPPVTFKEIK